MLVHVNISIDLSEIDGEALAMEVTRRLEEGEKNVETIIKDFAATHFTIAQLFPDNAAEMNSMDETIERLQEPSQELRNVIECAASIAFGDYTDLPRLKLVFNDAGVYGPSPIQLESLLFRE